MENQINQVTQGPITGRNRWPNCTYAWYEIPNPSNNARLSNQTLFLTHLFIRSFQVKIVPFLPRWFILPIRASIFPWALRFKIFTWNFTSTAAATKTSVTNMSATPATDDDGSGYGEWGVDAVSLFQQLINLYSRGRKFNVLETR